MSITVIAAVGRNNELGKDNDLIWHFHADMVFFREQTTGHPVIMGRKTFESLPKLLPKRRNIIITSNPDFTVEGAEICKSAEEAASLCKGEEAFVIGGGSVYGQFIEAADKILLTEIEADCPDAQVFFPSFDKSRYNREVLAVHEENGIKFSHISYTKK